MCQQYLVNKEMLLDHMDLKHPTVTPEPVVTESQVTEHSETMEADHQDCQVKCKYCDRHFKNVAECNMHIDRRHKKVRCQQCEKRFVKQQTVIIMLGMFIRLVAAFQGAQSSSSMS